MLTLVDPCPLVTLSLTANPFQDVDYNLRDPKALMTGNLQEFTAIDTLLYCGNFGIVFYNFDDL